MATTTLGKLQELKALKAKMQADMEDLEAKIAENDGFAETKKLHLWFTTDPAGIKCAKLHGRSAANTAAIVNKHKKGHVGQYAFDIARACGYKD